MPVSNVAVSGWPKKGVPGITEEARPTLPPKTVPAAPAFKESVKTFLFGFFSSSISLLSLCCSKTEFSLAW